MIIIYRWAQVQTEAGRNEDKNELRKCMLTKHNVTQ